MKADAESMMDCLVVQLVPSTIHAICFAACGPLLEERRRVQASASAAGGLAQ
jgi:hypothetical protein